LLKPLRPLRGRKSALRQFATKPLRPLRGPGGAAPAVKVRLEKSLKPLRPLRGRKSAF
jgi:hypothetical protein